jgi:hypothetical protein
MSRLLITALAAALPGNGIPTEIVYLPEGKHTITPQSHPKGITVNVPAERGDAIAAALQKDLEKRQAQNVQPWFDFEHTRKYPSAGNPVSFRYEKGKGVMCTVEWSRSGRLAIKGKDANYFSPEVYIDSEGVPNGLPERGPLGGVCTEPAFREIPPIAASDADNPSDKPPVMDFKILTSIGLLSANEAALEGAEELARSRVTALKAQTATITTLTTERDDLKTKLTATETERDGLKTKVTAAETAEKAAKEKRAKDLVEAAIADGRIAPKDDETAKMFQEKLTAGDEFAEKILASMTPQNPDLGNTVVNTNGSSSRVVAGKGGEHAFITEAKRLVTAKQAEDEEEAMGIVAGQKPDLYKAYVDSL